MYFWYHGKRVLHVICSLRGQVSHKDRLNYFAEKFPTHSLLQKKQKKTKQTKTNIVTDEKDYCSYIISRPW